MTEASDQNLAYQLLNEKYLVKPTNEELKLCEGLFTDWCKSGNISVLSHLLEFIDSHESKEIRDLGIKCLKNNLSSKNQRDIIELWITHPTPNLKEYILGVLNNSKLDKPILSACYVMLDEWDKFEELDPDFTFLDSYLQTIDPLMGSLLISRVNQLKSFEYSESQEEESIQDTRSVNFNIVDLIRSKNYESLWENLLQYPLPFICELLKILSEEEWRPKNQSDIEFYDLLIEHLGTKGWEFNDQFKWITINKKVGTKFSPLSDLEIRNRDFDLLLNSDLIHRPDRIESKKVAYRGKFNLVNPTIELFLYSDAIRKSEIDGKLHIPIYSGNGVELVEFAIPANSINSFEMDEDGLYFSVRNKSGLYSVDLDALAALLLPVSKHSEAVIEIIPALIEKSSKYMRNVAHGLELVSSLHRGREFSLWDLKEVVPIEEDETHSEDDTCSCSLGIDLGDSSTKIIYLPDENCNENIIRWEIPSLVHYYSPSDYIIGQEVEDQDLVSSTQTFSNWKHGFFPETQRFIRIRNARISAPLAAEHFISRLIENLFEKIDHNISRISMTYSLNLPISHLSWLRTILVEKGFSQIKFVDELTADILGIYKTTNERGNVMLIDIGSMKMGAVIVQMEGKKSRKRNTDERLKEPSHGIPKIVAKTQLDIGSYDITRYFIEEYDLDKESFHEINEMKHRLSYSYEEKVKLKNKETVFSIDKSPSEGVTSHYNQFLNGDLIKALKVIIRNTIIKATKRGVPKSELSKILISGAGSEWPLFLETIKLSYPDIELMIDKDNTLGAKGAALLCKDQTFSSLLEREYVLKLVTAGQTNYFKLMNRGEELSQKRKIFEIRKDANFETLVIDCWSRNLITQLDIKSKPIADDEYLEGMQNQKHYRMEKVFRDFVPIKEDVKFTIGILGDGQLIYGFSKGTMWSFVDSNLYIH